MSLLTYSVIVHFSLCYHVCISGFMGAGMYVVLKSHELAFYDSKIVSNTRLSVRSDLISSLNPVRKWIKMDHDTNNGSCCVIDSDNMMMTCWYRRDELPCTSQLFWTESAVSVSCFNTTLSHLASVFAIWSELQLCHYHHRLLRINAAQTRCSNYNKKAVLSQR